MLIKPNQKKMISASAAICLLFSLLISGWLYPIWADVFDYGSPIHIKGNLNANEYVKACWNTPNQGHKSCTKVFSYLEKAPTWEIEIEALGGPNLQSHPSQVWILDISTFDKQINPNNIRTLFNIFGNRDDYANRVNWQQSLESNSKWHFKNWHQSPQGKAIHTENGETSIFRTKISGDHLTIKFLRHEWSGSTRVTVNGQSTVINLFGLGLSSENFSLNSARELYQGSGQYEMNIGDPSLKYISFSTSDNLSVPIENISSSNRIVKAVSTGNFLIPLLVWNRYLSSLIASSLTCLILFLFLKSMSSILLKSNYCSRNTALFIISLSMIVSVFWMVVFRSPSVTTDAIAMLDQASRNTYDTWVPPLFAMICHVYNNISSNLIPLSIFQGLVFWVSILHILKNVIDNRKVFVCFSLLAVLLPPLWQFSIRMITDVWCASSILLSASFLISYIKHRYRISIILSLLFLSISVCFRHNAIILLLVPVFLINFFSWKSLSIYRRIIFSMLMILIIVIPSQLIQRLPNVSKVDMTGIVFVNQYVGTLVRSYPSMDKQEIKSELELIDGEFGEGTFNRLLNTYNCSNGDHIINGKFPIISRDSIIQKSSFITSSTLSLAVRHPVNYLNHKICNFSYVLQIPSVTNPIYYSTLLNPTSSYNVDWQNLLSQKIVRILSISTDYDYFLYRTWIFFDISFIILLFSLKNNSVSQIVIFSFSFIYTSSFALSESFSDWRYLLVSYIFSWISILKAFEDILNHIFKKYHSHYLSNEIQSK